MRKPFQNKYKLKRGSQKELTPEWQAFYARLLTKTFRNALTAFIFFLCRQGISPLKVTDNHVDAFVLYLATAGKPFSESLAGSAVKYWNLVTGFPALTPRDNAEIKREREWATFGTAIDSAIESFVTRHKADWADGGQHARNKMRIATRCVSEIAPVSSLDELCTTDALDHIAEAPEKDAKDIADDTADKRTEDSADEDIVAISDSTKYQIYACLLKYCNAETDATTDDARTAFLSAALDQLKTAMSEVTDDGSLSTAQLRRVIRFDTLTAYSDLIDGCIKIIERLGSSCDRKHDLPVAAAALITIVAITALLKPGKASRLEFSGPERGVGNIRRPTLSDNVEARLGSATVELIDDYYFWLLEILDRPPRYVAEMVTGGCRDQSTIGKDVRELMTALQFNLMFKDLWVLGVKLLIDSGCNEESIADTAGFAKPSLFRRRFRPLLLGNSAQALDDTLE